MQQLREARGLTQQQMAKLGGLPRATWANLESGAANPTLAVLVRVAEALQVRLEELIEPPRRNGRSHRAADGRRVPATLVQRRMIRACERAHRLEAPGVGIEHVTYGRAELRAEHQRGRRSRRAQMSEAGRERVVEVEHVTSGARGRDPLLDTRP